MDDRGGVCLEEEVERLRRSGMGPAEISHVMGVELAWVEGVVAMLTAGEGPAGYDPEKEGC